MKKRLLGKTGFEISEIGIGTWQVGGKWGSTFSHNNADAILNTAIDNGVNFIDTADVYSDGESEKAVGRLVHSRKERIYVATKCGRKLSPHIDKSYQAKELRKFVEDSLKNMRLETLDLIQLHCPPTETFYRPEIFELFNTLKKEGKILNLGVSVEKIDEALKAIEYDATNFIAYAYAGVTLEKNGKYAQAIEIFNKLINALDQYADSADATAASQRKKAEDHIKLCQAKLSTAE